MAKSNKPLIWLPFAVGGTVIAFCIPVIALLTFLVAIGAMPTGLQYDHLHAFIANPLVKIVMFGIVALTIWSSAHRLRCTFYDFGFRIDGLVAIVLYLVAAAGNVALAMYLLRI